MRGPSFVPLNRPVLFLLAVALCACADRNPAAVNPGMPPPTAALSVLLCTASVRAETMACRDGSPRPGGPSGDLIAGSPHVRLVSSSVGYNAGTGIFHFDMALQNLMSRPIGTIDGTAVAPQGIRVFFHSGPTVTEGAGVATVANPDGTAAFTAANQPYFRYDILLAPGATSAPRPWQIAVPPTVARFDFLLYVAAPAPNEMGRVDIYPPTPQLLVGRQLPLGTMVRTGAGAPLPTAQVTLTSSDTLVAKVDRGVVTGVSLGEATITATSGARTGTATVSVSTSDTQGPSLWIFFLRARSLDLAAEDSVVVVVTLADGGAGMGVGTRNPEVTLRPQNDSAAAHCEGVRTWGDDWNATWQCSLAVKRYWADVEYSASIRAWDSLDNESDYSAADLAARGSLHGVFVPGSHPDTVPPRLTGLSIFPDSVSVATAAAATMLTAVAEDAHSGLAEVTLVLHSPTHVHESSCSAIFGGGTVNAGSGTCSIRIPENVEGGAWTVRMRLTDRAGNFVDLSARELQALGIPARVQVTSPNPDVTPPAITAFSITHDSVDIAAGPVVVPFTITATDGGTGVEGTRVLLTNPSANLTLACDGFPGSGTIANGTWLCLIEIPRFAETGTWTVTRVSAGDFPGNSRVLDTSALQAAGFPTTVRVTN